MKFLSTLFTIFTLSALQVTQAVDRNDFDSVGIQTGVIKVSYANYLASRGVAPSNLEEFELPESYYQTELVKHIDIDLISGAIMIGLAPEFGQNEWIALTPNITNLRIENWVCKTTVSDKVASHSACETNTSYENLTQILDKKLLLTTLVQSNLIKLNAADYVATTGRFPQSMEGLGVSQDWLNSAKVSNVIVMPYFNTVLFALNDIYGVNQWLALRPKISNYTVESWTCKTTLPSSIANIEGCQSSLTVQKLIR